MNIEEIKANAPSGANFFQKLNSSIYYFKDGFSMWNGERWTVMFIKDMSHIFTPL